MLKRRLRVFLCLFILSALGACGAGGGGAAPAGPAPVAASMPHPSTFAAARVLSQSTFGPTMAQIAQLSGADYNTWLDAEFTKPAGLRRTYLDQALAALPAGGKLTQNEFFEAFWQQTIAADDQLRQRVAFALSQIFVVSLQDSGVAQYPRGVASYYDMLAANAFGNYRTLLEAVTLHPMMGVYLTSLHNQKESANRVPDENYAREVMQLMSIGLYQLNPDGSPVMSAGTPVETYRIADITGMAKVFTGWSWAGPDKSATRFNGGNPDPNRDWMPMQSYPQYHSTSQKDFLNVSIPAQAAPAPEASLKIALDTLYNHPNVGPFIGRQLIQRLVTSNPSAPYIKRVSAAFADNGAGVRGDMKAVIKAILLDPEARAADASGSVGVTPNNASFGKLREPVLRMAHWLRSFNAGSASGKYLIHNTDDALGALGQSAMRSPSVFNFYRPGFVPPNTSIAAAGLVAPEMQITAETSVTGYLNFMRDVVPNGAGTGRDVKPDYSAELLLADTPQALLDRVSLLLTSGQMSTGLQAKILGAINSVAIPANSPAAAATARKNRVSLAVFLTLASHEYIVQK
ncbi:MAG: DUF1800 family protein [Burkholderiaceae bacterium]